MASPGRAISGYGAASRMNGTLRQMLRFAAVGLINSAVGLAAIYGLMYFLGIPPLAANAAGYALGFTVGFMLNRIWTFESAHRMTGQVPRYLLVVCLCYAANLAATAGAMSFLKIAPYPAQLVGIGVYTSLAFWGCRRFVFTPHTRGGLPITTSPAEYRTTQAPGGR
jgi:putative flippase GtrA